MNRSLETEFDTYRLLIVRRNASELVVIAGGQGFSLPSLEIPRWERIAQQITTAVKDRWGFEAHCLFTPAHPADGPSPVRYQVMESSKPNDNPSAGFHWVPVASLSETSFLDPQDHRVIRSATHELESYAHGSIAAAFARPGWLREVMEWAQTKINPLGLTLAGSFRQLNASPTFSLLRFETDGPALWFKAVGEPNVREFSITRYLERMFPAFVPRLIAARAEWNAWLTTEAEGTHPDESSGFHTWMTAATTLADLQVTSFGQTFHLIDAGCRDIRPCSLVGLVEPFLEAMAGLMEQQTKVSPAPLSRQELRTLGAQLQEALSNSKECDIPNALGHLDFNPGNILISQDRCVFLDWAEACVGPPFFTFQYLLEHRRRLHGTDFASEELLVSSYARNWECFVSPREISAALHGAPLLAAFSYSAGALAWRNPETFRRPETAGYLRSLVRRMKREADALREGSLLCAR
jgi:hypothetical protein